MRRTVRACQNEITEKGLARLLVNVPTRLQDTKRLIRLSGLSLLRI